MVSWDASRKGDGGVNNMAAKMLEVLWLPSSTEVTVAIVYV